MTLTSVDLVVVDRQSLVGVSRNMRRDTAAAEEIMNGAITLQPYPVWNVRGEIDWNADPFGQDDWQAELHTLRWMEPVRLVALSGDKKACDFWLRTCRSWVAAHPSTGPGATDPVNHVWGDRVASMRALALTFGLSLTNEGEGRWLLGSLYEHGAWLLNSTRPDHPNSALYQAQALFVLGSVFTQRDWAAVAVDRMTVLLEESYDGQGINVDGAVGYHKRNLILWEEAFSRLDLEGIARPQSATRLAQARLELAYATKPDGKFELIGDTEPSGPNGLSSPELDYVKSQGSLGVPPGALTKVYDRGYIFGRSGWGDYERDFKDETFYSLSFGRADRVHGHQDGGALTLHSGGRSWLIDSGQSADGESRMRDYCVSREGHNVVHIPGRDYARASNVVLTRSSTDSRVDDFTFTDVGYAGVEIKRRVIYCRGGDFFLVVDTVLSDKEVEASQRWHLNAGTVVKKSRNGFLLEQGSNAAWIQWSGNMPGLSVVEGSESPFDGWMSDEQTVRRASPVISASQKGKRFRFITIIASPQSRQFELANLVATGGKLNLSTKIGRHQFNVAVDEDRATVSLGEQNQGKTLGIEPAWLKTLELCRLEGVAWTAPKPRNKVFTSLYWGKLRTWIRQQRGSRASRLEGLSILLNLLLDDPSNSVDDQGVRAAVVDVLGSDLGEEVGLSAKALGLLREPLIAWDDETQIYSPTYARSVNTIDSPAGIALSSDCSSKMFSANAGGLVLPFIVGRGSSDFLSVRFHGAINRNKTSLPFFQGLTAELAGEDSFALFQDPSLDLNRALALAWYLGAGDVDIHGYIAECLAKLQSELGTRKVLLSGSSGGGFTALQVASHLPESVALVFNPQTDVRAYFPNSSKAALDSCLREAPASGSPVEESTSVITRYGKLRVLPKVLYVQNLGDKHHVVNHRDPFRRMLDAEHPNYQERIRFIDVDWGRGHVAATRELQDSYRAQAKAMFGD